MAGRKVHLTLQADWGHPGNVPTKGFILETVTEELRKAVEKNKELRGWEIVKVEVE